MMRPASNQLIAQLNDETYKKLLPHWTLNSVEVNQWVFRPHEVIQFVYCPVSAIIALQIDVADGASADIVLVGKENMVGSGVMGGNQNFSRARVRFAGFVYKLPIEVFWSELANDRAFLKIWMAATRHMILQIAMPTVCSGRHTNEQQMVRWILADVLGVRRESITQVAGKLSQDGLIEVSRGQLLVLNRPGMEAKACACYRIMNPMT